MAALGRSSSNGAIHYLTILSDTGHRGREPLKHVWGSIGWASLALGIVGIFLPLLPTTPFVLLSAGCFAKSSPKARAWLENHKQLGPVITDWEERGAIAKKAKMKATLMILIVMTLSMWAVLPKLILVGMLSAIGLGCLVFIWSRPN